jgi:proline dehydrogenase
MNGPLLRAPVLWVAEQGWVRSVAAESRLGRMVARRFVAGETLEDALVAARSLNEAGIAAMLDHLGENVASAERASASADTYVRAVKRLQEADDLDCNIAIKLTQLGLDLSMDLCLESADRVLAAAASRGTLVMIDMESSEYVDRTLLALRELHRRYERVGVALQSYLYRTADDVFALPEGVPVRMVKGAYLEPESVAYRSRRDVDRAYARLSTTLLLRDHPLHVATHDPGLIRGARELAHRRGITWDRVEFQMLYGIRRDLQAELARDGYPVRTYIPYGTQWYPYLTRRLAERPANLWFFLTNLIRGFGPRNRR